MLNLPTLILFPFLLSSKVLPSEDSTGLVVETVVTILVLTLDTVLIVVMDVSRFVIAPDGRLLLTILIDSHEFGRLS